MLQSFSLPSVSGGYFSVIRERSWVRSAVWRDGLSRGLAVIDRPTRTGPETDPQAGPQASPHAGNVNSHSPPGQRTATPPRLTFNP